MRQTCEGNPHLQGHRSESSTVPTRRPSNTTASSSSSSSSNDSPSDKSHNKVVNEHPNKLSLSALVSPPSSLKNEKHRSPVAGSPLRRSHSNTVEADPVVASNPLSPAQTNSPHDGSGASPSARVASAAAAARGGRSGSRPVSPDTSNTDDDGASPAKAGVSGSAAKPKGKRARRTRGGDTTAAKSPPAPTVPGGRGSGGNGRKRPARRTAALVLASGKENRDIFASLDKAHEAGVAAGGDGSAAATAEEKGAKKKRRRKGSVLEQCVVDAMEKQEAEDEVDVGVHTQQDDEDSSAQRKEGLATQQGSSAVDGEGDRCGGGGRVVGESSPVRSAAAPAHGLLRRFAKAAVLDTRNEQVGIRH